MKIPCPSPECTPIEKLAYFRLNKDWKGGPTKPAFRGREAVDFLKGDSDVSGSEKSSDVHHEGISRETAASVLDTLRKKFGGFRKVEIISKEEAAKLNPANATRQGFYANGKMYLIHDNLDVTRQDIYRAGKYGGTPDEQAALRILAHEDIHLLKDFVHEKNEKGEYLRPQMVEEYNRLTAEIPKEQIEELRQRGLIKDKEDEGAREEFMALFAQDRLFRDSLQKSNPTLFEKILDFFKRVYAKLVGKKPEDMSDAQYEKDVLDFWTQAHDLSQVERAPEASTETRDRLTAVGKDQAAERKERRSVMSATENPDPEKLPSTEKQMTQEELKDLQGKYQSLLGYIASRIQKMRQEDSRFEYNPDDHFQGNDPKVRAFWEEEYRTMKAMDSEVKRAINAYRDDPNRKAGSTLVEVAAKYGSPKLKAAFDLFGDAKGSEKFNPAGATGKSKVKKKGPPLFEAETGEVIPKIKRRKLPGYGKMVIDEEGNVTSEARGTPFLEFGTRTPAQRDAYETWVNNAPEYLKRFDNYLGSQIPTQDVIQPLAPMVGLARDLLRLPDTQEPKVTLGPDGRPSGINVVTSDRTADALELSGMLATKEGARKLQSLFQQSDKNPDGLHQGEAFAAVVQMELLDYYRMLAHDMALDQETGGGKYTPAERKELNDFIRNQGKYVNKQILAKYITMSGAGRLLQVRSMAARRLREQGDAAILWDAYGAVERGKQEAAEQEYGKFGASIANGEGDFSQLKPAVLNNWWDENPLEVSKGERAPFGKVTNDELIKSVNVADDQVTSANAAKEAAQRGAKQTITEKKLRSKGKDAAIRDTASNATGLLDELQNRLDEQKGKGASKKRPLGELKPEELDAAIQVQLGKLNKLLEQSQETGTRKDTRKGWFNERLRKAADKFPGLLKKIEEFEERAAVQEQENALRSAINDQIQNRRDPDVFMAHLKQEFNLSDKEAKESLDFADEETKRIKEESEQRRKKRASDDPSGVIESKGFIESLINHILSQPKEVLANPEARDEIFLTALKGRGLSDEAAERAMGLLQQRLAKAWARASLDAINRVFKKLKIKGDPSMDTLIKASRVGLFEQGNPVMEALALKAGFRGLKPGDDLKLAKLDWLMSWHDPHLRAQYEREVYRILSEARVGKTALEIATQSFVNNALSGMTTAGLHWLSPVYVTMRQAGMDMLRSAIESKGNPKETFDRWHASIDALIDSYKKIYDEAKFALKHDATSREQIEVLKSAYSMEQDHKKSKEAIQEALKSGDKLALLGATTKYIYTSTDIVRRILASGFQTWGQTMHDYVLHSQAMRDLTGKVGMSAHEAAAKLQAAVNEAPRKVEERLRDHGQKPEDYTPLQNSVMQRDASNRLVADMVEMYSGKEGHAKELLETAKREAQTEQGTYQGEESPVWDVPSQLTTLVKAAAQAMRKKNELLGRIMMGFLTVPANVVNRSFYFTPLGIVRAMGKQKGWKGFEDYYKTTQATQAQTQMRMAEGVVGSLAMALIASLMLNEDKDHPIFNVTGSGPKDKQLRDAWLKQGHNTNSVEMQVGDSIVAIPYGRAGLEGLQIPMAALGALDDAKLNKSASPEKVDLMGQYAHEAWANLGHEMSSVATGGGLSGAFAPQDERKASFLAMKASAFVPFSSAFRSAFKLMGGDLDQSTLAAAVESQVPFLMLADRPALNALGDPIRNHPVEMLPNASERLYGQGFPLFIGVPPESGDAEVYRLFQAKGKGPSAPSYPKMEQDYGMKDPEEYQRFLQSRGRLIKSAIRSQIGTLRNLSQEDFKKALTKIDSDATKSTTEKMNLQKVNPKV